MSIYIIKAVNRIQVEDGAAVKDEARSGSVLAGAR
jgi:hypothetical protein